MRLIKTAFLAILLFLLNTNIALPGTRDPETPDEKYLEFGKAFPAVVRFKANIKCKDPKCTVKEHAQYGSAVIIRPHWIMTAAHVVLDTTEPEAIFSGESFPLPRVIPHKEFADNKFGYHDVALAYSPKAFKLDFYSPLYTASDEVGKAITISGYGMQGTFHTGCQHSDGLRRAGHNKIDSSSQSFLVCTPSRSGKFPLEFMIAPGDSGGGMFIGNKLAGINSFLMATDKKPDGTYGDESAFTRVSLYADWVESEISGYELALQGRATTASEINEGFTE